MLPVQDRKVRIRLATHKDIPLISTLGAKVFTQSFGHSVQPHELKKYLDESYSIPAIERDTCDASKTTLVATSTGPSTKSASSEDPPSDTPEEILGFTLLNRSSAEPCLSHLKDTVELQRIYVSPDHHGKGVGKLLAHAAEDIARNERKQWIWLGVWEENIKAQRFYEKLGYRVVGDHGFDVGGDLQVDFIMVKELLDS